MRRRRRHSVVGETLLWTLIVGLLAYASFVWAGIAVAIVFGVLHIGIRRRESTLPRSVLGAWHILILPGLLGITLAAVWPVMWVVLVPLLLVLWLGTPLPPLLREPSGQRPARFASLLVIPVVVWLCAISPKHLDRTVGPARYSDVPLGELCTRLGTDHDIHCTVDFELRGRRIAEFDVPRPMARREVLRKLAGENGLSLRFGGCGTGATLLWGAHFSPHLGDPH